MTTNNDPFPAQIGVASGRSDQWRNHWQLWRDPKNGYRVNTRSISFIIASVPALTPTGV